MTECKSQGYFLMTINGTVPLVVGQGMSDCVRTMPWFDDFNYQIEAEPATKGDPINPGVRLTKAQQRSLEHAHPELRSH